MNRSAPRVKSLIARIAQALLIGLALSACENPLAEKAETIRAENASSKMVLSDGGQIAIAAEGSLAYPDTSVGGDYRYTLTIANQGNKALTIDVDHIALTMGAGVTAGTFLWGSLPPATVAVGGSATFALRFAPATLGAKSATVTIPTNDVRYPRFTFTVTGTAIAAKLAISGISNLSVGASGASCNASITSDAGITVTKGGICWGASANPTTRDSKTEDGTSGSFSSSLSGLEAGTTYYVRAYGIYTDNGVEQTVYGEQASFPTLPAAPSAPSVAPVGYAEGSGKLDLSWSAVKGAIDYQLYYSSGNNPPTTSYTLGGITATSTQITGLTDYTTYYFWIRARNASGTGNWSPVASKAPGIHVESVAIEQSGIAFLGSGATYAQQLTAVVTPADATDPSVAWESSATGVCTVSASGLATAAGSLGSATITVTTTDQAKTASITASAQKPSAPTLTLVAGTKQIAASWAADATATGYSLAYGTSSSSLTNTATPSGNSYTITGLANNQIYYVAVTATNGFGSTTGATASTTTLLATPTNLRITSGVIANQLTLKWGLVSGATGYRVYHSTSPGLSAASSYTDIASGTTVSLDFNGTAGTTYYFAVAATDGRYSALSSEASAKLQILIANDTWASYSGSWTNSSSSLSVGSWTTKNSLSGWAISASTNYTGYYELASGNSFSSLSQTIDLVAAGYTAAQLQQAASSFSFQVAAMTRSDMAGRYYLTLELLDASGTLLATVDNGTASAYNTIAINTGWTWYNVSYDNTAGKAIAKVRVTLAGRDNSGWAGHYGTIFAQPRLWVTAP